MLLELATYMREHTKNVDKSNYMMLIVTMMEFVKGLESILPQVFDMIFDTYNGETM